MIRATFTATIIIVTAVVGYNVGNKFMSLLYTEAIGSPAPSWVIETVWWGWNHWIYLMLVSALLIIVLATQVKQSQEYEYG